MKGNSILAQITRLKVALKLRPMTTIEIRRELDIMEVAARIWDLRNKYGCEIHTQMIEEETQPGLKHKVARYSLIREVLK